MCMNVFGDLNKMLDDFGELSISVAAVSADSRSARSVRQIGTGPQCDDSTWCPGLEPGHRAARTRTHEPQLLQQILNPSSKKANGEPEAHPADNDRQRMHAEAEARKKLPLAEQLAIAEANLATKQKTWMNLPRGAN